MVRRTRDREVSCLEPYKLNVNVDCFVKFESVSAELRFGGDAVLENTDIFTALELGDDYCSQFVYHNTWKRRERFIYI